MYRTLSVKNSSIYVFARESVLAYYHLPHKTKKVCKWITGLQDERKLKDHNWNEQEGIVKLRSELLLLFSM